MITTTIDSYKMLISQPKVDHHSLFKQITRRLQMKKGALSKTDIIMSYMEEVKKDLMKNLDIDIRDDVSMTSAGHTTEGGESYMASEAQSDDNEEIDIDTLPQQLQNQVIERLLKESDGLPVSQVGV
ncbi:hypothetical protein H5410_060983 [Solanum commersonii]|uniref:Uncharacterized protein n=1 Tax=Solanum commersonii TaxID=4109 RepID=A0A9J5W6X0_SOLCO|nr:hypothetical protein H5410_060983 [Solanum commersonii]